MPTFVKINFDEDHAALGLARGLLAALRAENRDEDHSAIILGLVLAEFAADMASKPEHAPDAKALPKFEERFAAVIINNIAHCARGLIPLAFAEREEVPHDARS